MSELLDAQLAAFEINDLPVDMTILRTATVKMVAAAAIKLASERPEQLKDLESLAKLLLFSEDIDIRRRRLELAERCFHCEARVAARKDLPQLAAYLSAIGEDGTLSLDLKQASLSSLVVRSDVF